MLSRSRIVALAIVSVTAALTSPPAARAQTPSPLELIAVSMSARVLSVVSGGFWQDADGTARGYYRIVALRSADNTSRLYLQRIRLGADGPVLIDSAEVTALTDMRAYVTDMRPENSTGRAERTGFAAFVYLKRDPAVIEPETFALFVDDFGDVSFQPATN